MTKVMLCVVLTLTCGCVTTKVMVKDTTPYPTELVVPKDATLAVGELDTIYKVAGTVNGELAICHPQGQKYRLYAQFDSLEPLGGGCARDYGDYPEHGVSQPYMFGPLLPVNTLQCPEGSSKTVVWSAGQATHVICRKFKMQAH